LLERIVLLHCQYIVYQGINGRTTTFVVRLKTRQNTCLNR